MFLYHQVTILNENQDNASNTSNTSFQVGHVCAQCESTRVNGWPNFGSIYDYHFHSIGVGEMIGQTLLRNRRKITKVNGQVTYDMNNQKKN